MTRISPKEAAELMRQGWKYIDVRSEPEFERGRPEGAYNVPLTHFDPMRGMVPNRDFVRVIEALFPRDTKLVVGCERGNRSMRAVQILEAAGYSEVVDQRSGFGGATDPFGRVVEPGWRDAGLPVAAGAAGDLGWPALRAKADAAAKT
jgi:rhodanese-related sulfurtransferase